jgi:hypothetical protein
VQNSFVKLKKSDETMAAMSKRKMTRAKIADAYHQIESMRAQRPRMDLDKKSLPHTKNTKAIPQHESF